MLLQLPTSFLDTLSLSLLTLLSAVVVHVFTTWYSLRRIPGPLLAIFSNIPRVQWVNTRKAHTTHLFLHNKYGKLYQDPEATPIIYGFDGRFKKSNLYSVFRPYARTKVVTGMIAQQDEEHHKMLRKPFASTYSTRSLEPMEPLVSEPVEVFLDQIEHHSVEGQDIDLGWWLQLCIWDLLCNITFSKRFGFLDRGEDIDGMLQNSWRQFQEGAPISQMPWYDFVWRKNPVLMRLFPGRRTTPIVPFAHSQLKERKDRRRERSASSDELNDVLDRFLAAKDSDPEVPDWAIFTWTLGGLGAGGDTSTITVKCLFYNLLLHRESLNRLNIEIQQAFKQNPSIRLTEVRALPYLSACTKEAARLHPAIGLPLERIVTDGGTVISGVPLAAGTIVGINAWVVNRDPSVFGDDVESWRPERWLCPKEQRVRMEQTMFSFGGGHRMCPGQNLFDLIASRLLVSFFTRFEAELAHPEVPLEVENSWLVRQYGIDVKVKSKASKA